MRQRRIAPSKRIVEVRFGPLAEVARLPFPLRWEWLQQAVQGHLWSLSSVQDCLDDLRRQQGQAQDTADIGAVDLFDRCQFGKAGVMAFLQQAFPAVGSGERLNQRAVDLRL